MFRIVVFLILCCSFSAIQAQDLFKLAANTHQLKPELLRSIAEMESQLHPWAVNLNWEGFKPDSKREAIELIEQAQEKPWLLKLEYGEDDAHRMFYSSEKDAREALKDILTTAQALDIPRPQNWEVRLLDTRSVDVGMMQINWKFHGRHFESLEELFDPKVNILYAAKYLRKLIWRHGKIEQAVAFYHSNTHHFQSKYLALFRPIYQKQLLLAKR